MLPPESPEHSAELQQRRDKAYVHIRAAREWAAAHPRKKLAPSTRIIYREEAHRLIKGRKSVAEVWAAAADTTRPSVFRRRRASLVDAVHQELSIQDQMQREKKPPDEAWFACIRRLNRYLAVARQAPLDNPVSVTSRTPRKSKRSTVAKLPSSWHTKLLSHMPSAYSSVALVNAVTGCRPAEIKRGITFRMVGTTLVARILGVKLKEGSGLPWRELEWDLADPHPLVKTIAGLVGENNGPWTVTLEDAKRYSSAVRTAGRRAFPKLRDSVTPYCFRHAAASAGKATMSRDEVAIQLGHQSNATASTYGSTGMGRKSAGLAPDRVRTAPGIQVRDKIKHPPRPLSGPVPGD